MYFSYISGWQENYPATRLLVLDHFLTLKLLKTEQGIVDDTRFNSPFIYYLKLNLR